MLQEYIYIHIHLHVHMHMHIHLRLHLRVHVRVHTLYFPVDEGRKGEHFGKPGLGVEGSRNVSAARLEALWKLSSLAQTIREFPKSRGYLIGLL